MDWKPLLQNKWLLVLALLGIACLVLGSAWKPHGSLPTLAASGTNAANNQTAASSNAPDPTTADASMYDRQLQTMLSQIAGVNQVSVMVTLDSTNHVKLATNTREMTQKQTNGQTSGSTSTTVDNEIFTVTNPDGSRSPYVEETSTPTVRGVLVVVDAQDFFVAKSQIIDAIKNVLDVPAYKISVEPKKSNS